MDERRIPSMDDVITITDKRANELPSDSLISINTGGVALVGFRRRGAMRTLPTCASNPSPLRCLSPTVALARHAP